jgi:hypothetical protein
MVLELGLIHREEERRKGFKLFKKIKLVCG